MSLRNLKSVHLFCLAVALVGAALLAVLFALPSIDLHPFGSVDFLALAPAVMLGELFPLELPRRSGDGEVTVSTMFSFALLLGVGLVPALVAQLAASIAQDRIARKPWWQVAFNIGQYTLSIGAAAGVLELIGDGATLRAGGFVPF